MRYENSVSLETLMRDLQAEYLCEGFNCEGLRFNELLARVVVLQNKQLEQMQWRLDKLEQGEADNMLDFDQSLDPIQCERSCFKCKHVYLQIVQEIDDPTYVPWWCQWWCCQMKQFDEDASLLDGTQYPEYAQECVSYEFSQESKDLYEEYAHRTEPVTNQTNYDDSLD